MATSLTPAMARLEDTVIPIPTPDDSALVVRVPPLAFLRAMVNLFWSAILHPLSETTIDLSTGQVLYRD